MTTIRRLTPTSADNRALHRINDPRQRLELLDHVLRTLIQRADEGNEDFMARAEQEVDRMSMRWRTFSDLEMRSRERVSHTSDYDVTAAMWR